jgi:hypothetical protein
MEVAILHLISCNFNSFFSQSQLYARNRPEDTINAIPKNNNQIIMVFQYDEEGY